MIDLEAHFKKAEEGKVIWENLDNKYHADLYMIFPHVNDSYNYFAMLYFDEYIKNKSIDNIVFVCDDIGLKKSKDLFTCQDIQFENMELEKIHLLLKYYALFEFTTRLKIISLTIPYNTRGENLLGVKGVTKEELLCFDIYRFDHELKVKEPYYDGADEDIIKFMQLGIDELWK